MDNNAKSSPEGNQNKNNLNPVKTKKPIIGLSSIKNKISKKISLKVILIVVILLVLIGGGGTFALVSIILPNQPQNILKSAIFNSLSQTQVSSNGNIQISDHSISGKLNFTTQSNLSSNNTALNLNLNLTIYGFNLPVNMILLNGNVYFKLGNINSIAGLVGSINPQASNEINALSSKISNKWFYIDSTLINADPQAKCFLNNSLAMPSQYISDLENSYSQNQFITISSTSNTQLNGINVQKMNIVINNPELANFLTNLGQTSVLKQNNECAGNSLSVSALKGITSKYLKGTSALSVWINKSTKEIVQISGGSKSSSASYSYTVDFSYQPVNIVAPSNPEPITNLLSSLGSTSQTPLL